VTCEADDSVRQWAQHLADFALPMGEAFTGFRTKLERDLVAVGDTVLTAISRECAEITPRIQLSATEKTVQQGPFYSEYLPTETLLVSLIEAADAPDLRQVAAIVTNQVVHIGGDETIGKGLTWCRLVGTGDDGDPTQN